MKVLPTYCTGRGVDEQSAWKEFARSLDLLLTFTTGFRYWRTTPACRQIEVFNPEPEKYIVTGRVIITDTQIQDYPEITPNDAVKYGNQSA